MDSYSGTSGIHRNVWCFTQRYCNELISVKYNQFYSFNSNLHQYYYQSLTHHPPHTTFFHSPKNLPMPIINLWLLGIYNHNKTSRDDHGQWNYVLCILRPCHHSHFYQQHFQIVSHFQLENICKGTIVGSLPLYVIIHQLPR